MDIHDLTPLPHDHGNGRRAAHLVRQLECTEDFSAVAEVFHLLDDTSRLKIFWLLCHCEECVLNISAMTGLSSPAVSHHLRLLRESRLISWRRDGREVYYKTADTQEAKLLHGIIEKVMEISCPRGAEEELCRENAASFSAEQVETVRRMHDDILSHPEQRMTIEELSKRYLMNPTTLKECFKAVYGDSLASHMKEHRMEKAGELLSGSGMSVAEVSAAVGYDSPSRFSGAFREHYGMLPSEYRKQRRKHGRDI